MLGYVLFGIMTRPALAAVGVGIAASYFLPSYLAGDAALAVFRGSDAASRGNGHSVDTKKRRCVRDEPIVLEETIHQSTRLRINDPVGLPTLHGSRCLPVHPENARPYGGKTLTIHLRKLRDAGYLTVTKEFRDEKPSTWAQATPKGRQAFVDYLANLEKVLKGMVLTEPGSSGTG